jgi:hypothetical protein
MMTDMHRPQPTSAPTEDARDLLARLCRELGVAAVAAELEITETAASEKAAARTALELAQQALAA